MPRGFIHLAESAVRDLGRTEALVRGTGCPQRAGERTLRRILDSIRLLEESPDLGRIVPEFGQRSLRALIRPPFRMVYRREPEGVSIVRIWRSERFLEVPEDETRG